MRQLRTHDLFTAMKVVKNLNISEEIKSIAAEMANGKSLKQQEQIGAQLILTVIGNMGDDHAEKAVYNFLSGPFECDPEEIREMELPELREKIREFIELIGIDGWKDFFGSLASMTK